MKETPTWWLVLGRLLCRAGRRCLLQPQSPRLSPLAPEMSTDPEFEIFCEKISKDDGFDGFTPWRCSTRRQLWEWYEEPDWRLSAPNSLSVETLKCLQLADTFIFLFACWDPEIILWTVALVGAIYAMAILPGVGYFPMTHVEFYPTALSLDPNPKLCLAVLLL